MATATEIQPVVVDEKIWSAWLQESRVREAATAKKAKVIGAIVVVLLAAASAFYLLAVK